TSSGLVYLWDLESGKQLHRLQCHWFPVRGVTFTPDGRRFIASTTSRGGLVVCDVETGKQLHRLAPALPCGGLAASPDGRWFATANADHKVHLWTLDDDTLRARELALQGEIDRAEAAYREAVEKRPEDADLRVEWARFYARQKKWGRATAEYAAA